MTIDELNQLTPEQKRVKISKACGWSIHQIKVNGLKYVAILPPNVSIKDECAVWKYADVDIPDYLSDLNAMHEAEKVLLKKYDIEDYTDILKRICYINRARISYASYQQGVVDNHIEWVHATAAQRADAFLLTVG